MFMPRDYTYEMSFEGNVEAAFDVARTALLAQGFEILSESASEMHAEGPGMSNNKQPPLLGATKLHLQIDAPTLSITGVLGGVKKMKMFLYLFPPCLILSLMVPSILSGLSVSWYTLLWITPWIVIAPLLGTALENKTKKAMEGLVRSMVQVAKVKE